MDLAQALCNEVRLELSKAKDKFQSEAQIWQKEKTDLLATIQEHVLAVDERDSDIRQFDHRLEALIAVVI